MSSVVVLTGGVTANATNTAVGTPTLGIQAQESAGAIAAATNSEVRLARALVTAGDVPSSYGAYDDELPLLADQKDAPDLCPMGKGHQTKATDDWAVTQMGTHSKYNANNSAYLGNMIWKYDESVNTKHLAKKLAKCQDGTRKQGGEVEKVDVEDVEYRNTMVQQSKVRSNQKPKRSVFTVAWAGKGKYLTEAEVVRVGKSATHASDDDLMKDARTASKLAKESLKNARHPSAQFAATSNDTGTDVKAAASNSPHPNAESNAIPGAPWVVSIGDSYISGEGGRWAGNPFLSADRKWVDKTGDATYRDNADGSGEELKKCHRSMSAEIHIGNGVNSKNLACSGAETVSAHEKDWKPGIDFATNDQGQRGQAYLLQEFAKDHDVEMVALSIGGNDMQFGPLIKDCVTDFLTTSNVFKVLCSRSKKSQKLVSDLNVDLVSSRIAVALRNVYIAMRNAGYQDDEWFLSYQNAPAPLPQSSKMRYWQTQNRQLSGGCGLWDEDIDWALGTFMPAVNKAINTGIQKFKALDPVTNLKQMDVSSAFDGHRLCEKGTDTIGKGFREKHTETEWANTSEWIATINITTFDSDIDQDESMHPNYWGQMALRNCLRQMYNTKQNGKCTVHAPFQLQNGEPRMTFK